MFIITQGYLGNLVITQGYAAGSAAPVVRVITLTGTTEPRRNLSGNTTAPTVLKGSV